MTFSFGSTPNSREHLSALLDKAQLQAWQYEGDADEENPHFSSVRDILCHPSAPRSWPQIALRDAMRLDWWEMIEMLLSLPHSRRPRPSRMNHSCLKLAVMHGYQASVAALVDYTGPGRICVIGKDDKPTRLAIQLYLLSQGGLVAISLEDRGHPRLWLDTPRGSSDLEEEED